MRSLFPEKDRQIRGELVGKADLGQHKAAPDKVRDIIQSDLYVEEGSDVTSDGGDHRNWGRCGKIYLEVLVK